MAIFMLNNQTVTNILPHELLNKAVGMKEKNLRLIAISCTKKENLSITYSFDNNYNMENLRLDIDFNTEIDSISGIFEYAYLYENEIKDLFKVKINDISIDFKGNFYRIKENN